ncbi:MAG: HAD-IC family P-type ATPase, partial [bacterium]|nr:HAD-IC family P-type ATPase [bacterium]
MTEFVIENAHAEEIEALIDELKSDQSNGLSADEASRRLLQFGENHIVESGRKTALAIAWEQVSSILIVVLIVAAVISAALGDFADAIAIGAIVVLNAALGFYQEFRAEKAIAALKRLAVPSVRVRRDGEIQERSALELVPGDIVLLEAGNKVPADGRLIESAALKVEEAALTGESASALKDSHAKIAAGTDLGSRVTMSFQGTNVVQGRGAMLVTSTGMETELGKIASMLQAIQRDSTPLQKRLDRLGKWISIVALVIVALIFVMGIPGAGSFAEIELLFLTAVSLAVAAVPEGLPAVVTIALSLGSQRMLKQGALIRNLPAVETLGSVTTICSDKTGTLTRNEMTVSVVDVAGGRLEMSDAESKLSENAAFLLAAGDMCNDATVATEQADGETRTTSHGDPTETAIAVAAAKVGISKTELETALPRVSEVPFDSVRKRMTTVHKLDGNKKQVDGALRHFPQQ